MEDLYNLIYWGNYDQRIDTLAKMTNENWNFKGMTNNLILKNYRKKIRLLPLTIIGL